MVWADAVGTDGLVTGLEVSPEYAMMAQAEMTRRGFANTEIIVGDALDR
jgi:predicted O-methyltransferase YrrM